MRRIRIRSRSVVRIEFSIVVLEKKEIGENRLLLNLE